MPSKASVELMDCVQFYIPGTTWKSDNVPLECLRDFQLIHEIVTTYEPDIVESTRHVWTVPMYEHDFARAFPWILRMVTARRSVVRPPDEDWGPSYYRRDVDIWPVAFFKDTTYDELFAIMSACEILLYDPGFVAAWNYFFDVMTGTLQGYWHPYHIYDFFNLWGRIRDKACPTLPLLAGMFSAGIHQPRNSQDWCTEYSFLGRLDLGQELRDDNRSSGKTRYDYILRWDRVFREFILSYNRGSIHSWMGNHTSPASLWNRESSLFKILEQTKAPPEFVDLISIHSAIFCNMYGDVCNWRPLRYPESHRVRTILLSKREIAGWEILARGYEPLHTTLVNRVYQ